jgi:hypothetical protein
MSEELQLTRRGLLQIVTAIAVMAQFAVRPRNTIDADDVLEAELIDDERVDSTRERRATKLEGFLRSRGIKPVHLARESGYSRQHLLRLRIGKMEPTRRCIAALVVACCRITRKKVKASDLFNLEAV